MGRVGWGAGMRVGNDSEKRHHQNQIGRGKGAAGDYYLLSTFSFLMKQYGIDIQKPLKLPFFFFCSAHVLRFSRRRGEGGRVRGLGCRVVSGLVVGLIKAGRDGGL